MAYGSKTGVKTTFKDCVVRPKAKNSTGGNVTAAKGVGLPIVVGVAGLPGKASGLKPPTT